MHNEETRKAIDELYLSIKESNEALEIIRDKCSHEHTHKGLYEWRVGTTFNAELCDYCDKMIKNLDMTLGITVEGV